LMEYEGGIYLGEYERAVKNVSTSYGKWDEKIVFCLAGVSRGIKGWCHVIYGS
jgi:hypothetical protein